MAGDVKSSPGTRYPQYPVLGRVLFIFCALLEMHSQSMCALKGYTGTVTGFSTSCSLQCHPHTPLPISPPFPVTPLLSPLTGQHAGPLCHLSISETAPQGASVTELGAAACCLCLDSGKAPPSPSVSSLSPPLCLALFCSPCCPLQTQTHRTTHTYRVVIASVSYFLHLPPGTKEPPLHHHKHHHHCSHHPLSLPVTCGQDARYSGRRVRQERCLLIQRGKIGISLKQMTFNEFQQAAKHRSHNMSYLFHGLGSIIHPVSLLISAKTFM